MTDVIETPTEGQIEDPDPTVDISPAEFARWESEVNGVAPRWFLDLMEGTVGSIRDWWETPTEEVQHYLSWLRINVNENGNSWDRLNRGAQERLLTTPWVYVGLRTNLIGRGLGYLGYNLVIFRQAIKLRLATMRSQINTQVARLDGRVNDTQRIIGVAIKNEVNNRNLALRSVRDHLRIEIAGDVKALKSWSLREIFAPLEKEIAAVKLFAQTYTDKVTTIRHEQTKTDIANAVAPVAASVALLTGTVTALQDFNNECARPMCETMGPKTDWGKWLKKFGPLALWAMLAAVAAENPETIEHLATELGETLGPVLTSWVEQWAGGAGGFGKQPGDVSSAIGGNPLVL